jgi:hypothetical protein
MLSEETNKKLNTAPTPPEAEIANEESTPEETRKGNWREAFRTAFDKARRRADRNSAVTRANRCSC